MSPAATPHPLGRPVNPRHASPSPEDIYRLSASAARAVFGRIPGLDEPMTSLGAAGDRRALAAAIWAITGAAIEADWLERGRFGGFVDRVAAARCEPLWS